MVKTIYCNDDYNLTDEEWVWDSWEDYQNDIATLVEYYDKESHELFKPQDLVEPGEIIQLAEGLYTVNEDYSLTYILPKTLYLDNENHLTDEAFVPLSGSDTEFVYENITALAKHYRDKRYEGEKKLKDLVEPGELVEFVGGLYLVENDYSITLISRQNLCK